MKTTFVDKNGASSTTNTFEGKHFTYEIYRAGDSNEKFFAQAQRGGIGGYVLNFTPEGKKGCWAYGKRPENIKLCKAIVGATIGTGCISGDSENECYVE